MAAGGWKAKQPSFLRKIGRKRFLRSYRIFYLTSRISCAIVVVSVSFIDMGTSGTLSASVVEWGSCSERPRGYLRSIMILQHIRAGGVPDRGQDSQQQVRQTLVAVRTARLLERQTH